MGVTGRESACFHGQHKSMFVSERLYRRLKVTFLDYWQPDCGKCLNFPQKIPDTFMNANCCECFALPSYCL